MSSRARATARAMRHSRAALNRSDFGTSVPHAPVPVPPYARHALDGLTGEPLCGATKGSTPTLVIDPGLCAKCYGVLVAAQIAGRPAKTV